jgi:steroid 5-alpha reductase family enzyme
MSFFQIYILGLWVIVAFFSLIWILSVFLKNASIVDIFWGLGFVLVNGFYFYATPGFSTLKTITIILVSLWGLRLSAHIFFRNLGKPEDYRYQEFRRNYGEKRYWWFSFFQVFLLQGTLVWLISAPLLAINFFSAENTIWPVAILGILLWVVGFTFEAGGDWQLARFKANPANRGKLLTTGFWKYTRHPNYFGDAAVWWGFAVLSIAVGCWLPVLSSVLMTWLIIKVSGVSMLERTMKNTKPGFEDYIKQTNSFLPWFPKRTKTQS